MARLSRIEVTRGEPSEADAARAPFVTYYMILVSAIVLAVMGLLMTFSASTVSNIAQGLNPYVQFAKNFMIIVGGVILAIFLSRIPPSRIQQWTLPLFIIGVLAQTMVLFFGLEQGGHTSWVYIPGINQTFQPGEFLKLSFCLFLASVCVNLGKRIFDWKTVALALGVPTAVALAALMLSDDVGTTLVFLAIIIGTLWAAGAPLNWFPKLGLVAAGGLGVLVALNPTRLRRIKEMLPGHGTAPNVLEASQTDHGLWALGSGGLTGLGPGASREKWDYLPEAHTDFILAIIGEEFGLLGTLTVVAAIGILVWGVLRLSRQTNNAFVRIAGNAIACWILAQAFINIGMVTGLTPVIGVPLPLVSHGGSAFLFTAMAVGVLLSFARFELVQTGGTHETARRDPRRLKRRRAK